METFGPGLWPGLQKLSSFRVMGVYAPMHDTVNTKTRP